jgi:manganese transport protein
MFFPLPRTATAPFCPSEVKGSVAVPQELTFFKKLMRYRRPGLLVSVGYMDPGNWATDIEAGSRFGYGLLFVVLLASLAAMLLQTLCVRLGLVTQKDLARACREHYSPRVNRLLWLGAELAIVACDLAEVLGSALALHLLFGVSIPVGIAITAFDTLLVLGLQGAGFRRVEAIVLGLVGTIAGCFVVELAMAPPNWFGVAMGFAPSLERLHQPGALYLAIGIVGATVMPHNLYLHSSIVQTRLVAPTDVRRAARRCASARSTRWCRCRSRCWSTRPSWCWPPAPSTPRGTARWRRSTTPTGCSSPSWAAPLRPRCSASRCWPRGRVRPSPAPSRARSSWKAFST